MNSKAMARSGSGESQSSSFGGEQSPLAHRGEDPTPQSFVDVATSMGEAVPSSAISTRASTGGDGHRTVLIGGELPRTMPIGGELPRTAEVGDETLYAAVAGGISASNGETSGPIGGDPSIMVTGGLPASGVSNDRSIGGDSTAMQGGESGSMPMEVDMPGTGAQLSEVEMDIGGVHVMVEQRSDGEGTDAGFQESLVPSGVSSVSLVTEVPIGGEQTSVVIPVVRRDLGKEKVIVEEARDSSSGGEEMEVGALDPPVVPVVRE